VKGRTKSGAASASALRRILASCTLCPRMCRVNRITGETGYCKIGPDAVVSSAGPHFGEEPPLVGRGGSGTIFFAGCNLGCIFCQNYEISHLRRGERFTVEELCRAMLRLEEIGCHNVNLVTPTHQVPAIVDALLLARDRGLTVPVVYNSGGYERVETLRLLEGLIEIYMPDAKYLSPEMARRYSDAPDYPDAMKAALREMHRQVGDLEIERGLARRGLLIRHLVMPGGVEDSIAVLDFIAREISPRSYVNVMEQYRPAYRAPEFPEIARRVTPDEYMTVLAHARRLGLRTAD